LSLEKCTQNAIRTMVFTKCTREMWVEE
jgi:hypothetical protein